jgi:hypothetical protein
MIRVPFHVIISQVEEILWAYKYCQSRPPFFLLPSSSSVCYRPDFHLFFKQDLWPLFSLVSWFGFSKKKKYKNFFNSIFFFIFHLTKERRKKNENFASTHTHTRRVALYQNAFTLPTADWWVCSFSLFSMRSEWVCNQSDKGGKISSAIQQQQHQQTTPKTAQPPSITNAQKERERERGSIHTVCVYPGGSFCL